MCTFNCTLLPLLHFHHVNPGAQKRKTALYVLNPHLLADVETAAGGCRHSEAHHIWIPLYPYFENVHVGHPDILLCPHFSSRAALKAIHCVSRLETSGGNDAGSRQSWPRTKIGVRHRPSEEKGNHGKGYQDNQLDLQL